MDRDKMTHTQLTALIWAAMLAPAAELLPVLTLPVAEKGAWLAPVTAIPLVLLGGWLLGRLSGDRGLAGGLRESFGPVAGGLILLLYMVWAEVLLALRLRLCARRLLASGYRDGSLWFFLLGIAAVILWIGLGRVGALARAGQLFLVILLTTGIVVLLLSLSRVRLERVLPLWGGDVVPVLWSGVPAAGALGWGIYGAFLLGQVEPRETRGRWYGLFWGAGGCLLLALSQLVILGNLGPTLAGRLEDPFFALAKSVGVEGAFQRIESVIVALWTLADLAMGAMLLFALRIGAAQLKHTRKEGRVAAVAMALAVVLALVLLPNDMSERWNREVVPLVNLILGLALPFVLLLLRSLFGKRRAKRTSCGG